MLFYRSNFRLVGLLCFWASLALVWSYAAKGDPKPCPAARDGLSFVPPSLGRISSNYGWRYGRFHSGLDIDDSNGRDIRASESGEVVFSDLKGDYGWTVIIDHWRGWRTLYSHNLKNYVRPGQVVLQGRKIAKMGASGKATGVHVHFEIRHKGKTVDPLETFKKVCNQE